MASPDWLHHLTDVGEEWTALLGGQVPEQEVSLPEFVDSVGDVLVTFHPPGYDASLPNAARMETTILAPKIQLLMWLLIDQLYDFFRGKICLRSLAAENIRVNKSTCRPRLTGVVPTDRTKAKIQENVASLAEIFSQDIIARDRSGKSPPYEVRNLLVLMQKQALKRLYLIRIHPSLCPLENRGAYFLCLHNIAADALDDDAYQCVINNLDFDTDWDVLVGENTFLNAFYVRDGYMAQQGNPADENTQAGEEVMRFYLDVLLHWVDLSRHPGHPFGLRLKKVEVIQMLYSVLHRVTSSMAISLDFLGIIGVAGLEHLFPGQLIKHAGTRNVLDLPFTRGSSMPDVI